MVTAMYLEARDHGSTPGHHFTFIQQPGQLTHMYVPVMSYCISFFTEQRNSDALQLVNNCSYRTALVIKYRVIVKFVMHNVYNSPTILLEIT